MNQKTLKIVIDNKEKLIPHLFTKKQIEILHKHFNKKKLNNTQKTYLYSSIKKKVQALEVFNQEFYITGGNMIQERVVKAKNLLSKLNKKAFISGSFLYSKTYNDIDVYVISKRRKSYHKDKTHFTCITEKDLQKPIFYSALKCSVSNFSGFNIQPEVKRPGFDELVMAYELAINEILDNDDQKMIRDLIFEHNMQVKSKILDSFSLDIEFKKVKSMKKTGKIDLMNNIIKELLLHLFSNKYLYNELGPFLKKLMKTINEYKTHDNVIIYYKTFSEVKNECRKAKT